MSSQIQRKTGITFAEILISVAIFATAVVGFFPVFSQAIQISKEIRSHAVFISMGSPVVPVVNCQQYVLSGKIADVDGDISSSSTPITVDWLVVGDPTDKGTLNSYLNAGGGVLNADFRNARGKRQKQASDSAALTIHEPLTSKKEFRKNWARLIQKIYEIDQLLCPKCGGEMRIIAFIEEQAVIEKILKHLGLWLVNFRSPPRKPASRGWEELPEYTPPPDGFFPDPDYSWDQYL